MSGARLLSLALGLAASCLALPALAYGPAVHLRECIRAAELLASQPGPLGQVGSPANRPWLALGCIAPDFRQASKALSAVDTHAWQLGKHLMTAASLPDAPTGALAFAVGHLAHHTGDASESFFAARLTASALLGAPDLIAGAFDDGYGECEMWVETLGEFANGDTAALVQLLADLGAFGPAPLPWQTMLAWYVGQANAWHGKPKADPVVVNAELAVVLNKAQAALAGLDADQVKGLLSVLAQGTPKANVALLSNLPLDGALAAFGINLAAGLDPVRWRPLSALPAFATHDLWHGRYALPFADLGPGWARDLALGSKLDAGWPPSHDGLLMQAGARISLAWGMPAGWFAPQHAVVSDDMGFVDAAGKAVAQWPAPSGPVTAYAKLFANEPVATWVALRVHADPGTVETADLGALVTATSAPLNANPATYFATGKRLTIAVPLDPAPWVGKARGLVLALARGDSAAAALAAKPFLHGNWARYQAHATLEVFGPVYDDKHATYGGWPAGLRLAVTAPETKGSVIVRVLAAPGGNALGAVVANVRAAPNGPVVRTLVSTARGRLLADGLSPGQAWFEVSGTQESLAAKGADGLPAPLSAAVTVTAGAIDVAVVRAWALPQVEAATVTWPSTPDGDVDLHLRLLDWPGLGDQAARMQWEVAAAPTGPAVWPVAPQPQLSEPLPLDDTAAAGKQPVWTRQLPAPLLAAAGLGPGLPLTLRVRLVYGDTKAGLPSEAARGPWVTALATAPAPAPVEPDTGGADQATFDAAVAPDAGATAGSADATTPAPVAPAAPRDGGCVAAQSHNRGWAWLLAVFGCGVLCLQRRALSAGRRAPKGNTAGSKVAAAPVGAPTSVG